MAEIEKSWKSYISFSADYLKKKRLWSCTNKPDLFSDGSSFKATKPVFSFLCLFCVIVSFGLSMRVCFFGVMFGFVSTILNDRLGRTCLN